jgi:UDP-glucose 4-epimerase
MKAIVTGGAGFIGSHLADALVGRGDDVIAIDNLSSGRADNLKQAERTGKVRFYRGDLKEPREWEALLADGDVIYHFAADPEVQIGETSPEVHFKENLVATFNLLEAMRKAHGKKTIVFASTSTIYGEAAQLPTTEDYGPLFPISTYGASKLGCEGLISSYAYTFGLKGVLLRFGNVVGARAQHGVILDMIRRLRGDSTVLEILGDGTQKKSYIHVSDCVRATLFAIQKFISSKRRLDAYNVSSWDQIDVKRIAEIVVQEMGLKGVDFKFTGGVDGGRGWLGDVKTMQLSVEKLSRLGWRATMNSEEAVRIATQELLTGS